MRRSYLARLRAADDRDELERHTRTAATAAPFLQQARRVALHQLKAATEVRLDPAVDVLQPLRQRTAVAAHPLVDRHHVVVAKPFDDHEQHERESCQVGVSRATRRSSIAVARATALNLAKSAVDAIDFSFPFSNAATRRLS
jgi:hypothetical protein